MTAPKVRTDYESLGRLAGSFQQQAEGANQAMQRVRGALDALRGGDWMGLGATAFFQEMDSQVMPTLQRLRNALQEGGRVSNQINQLMRQAEADASRVLHADGGGAAGGGTAGGAAAGGAAAGGAAGGAAAGGGAAARPDPSSDTTEQMLADFPPDVRDLANQSPALKAQLGALAREGWTIQIGPAGGGSFTDRENLLITMADGDTPAVTAGGLAHEMGHASTPEPPFHAPTATMTRDQFIGQNVQEQLRNEGEAQLNAATARDQIGAAGGPDTGIPGTQTAAYQVVYDDFKGGNITRAEAVEQMANLMGNENTSNTGENYRQYYGKTYQDYWDQHVAPPGGTP